MNQSHFIQNHKQQETANRYINHTMEMCDNGTLKDWLESRKNVDYIQSLHIFRQLVQALSHIHQNHICIEMLNQEMHSYVKKEE